MMRGKISEGRSRRNRRGKKGGSSNSGPEGKTASMKKPRGLESRDQELLQKTGGRKKVNLQIWAYAEKKRVKAVRQKSFITAGIGDWPGSRQLKND